MAVSVRGIGGCNWLLCTALNLVAHNDDRAWHIKAAPQHRLTPGYAGQAGGGLEHKEGPTLKYLGPQKSRLTFLKGFEDETGTQGSLTHTGGIDSSLQSHRAHEIFDTDHFNSLGSFEYWHYLLGEPAELFLKFLGW